MNELYPLKFKPLFMEKIWGGHKIKDTLGLDFGSLSNCGEAWVLSGIKGNHTEVSNGFLAGNELNELVEVYMGDLVGDEVFEKYGDEFPLLLKFIDSNDYLSIQVHPDDYLARQRNMPNGKTEMWYILDADPGAELISGFNKKMDKETYLNLLEQKRLKEVLHIEKVSKGEVFFTPGGRIHAIGPGILLAEIQQASDCTYRIYDWDRRDEKGQERELHTGLALDAIDFNRTESAKTEYKIKEEASSKVIRSPYFNTNIIHTRQSLRKDYSEVDSFIIYLCTEGHFKVAYPEGIVEVSKGEVLLIPNLIKQLGIIPETTSTILETYIPY
jgi:mannose-6-phosphate isomerase